MPTFEVREHEPLKPFTSFKIGGPARYFAPVASAHDIPPAIDFARSRRVPIFVLGGGSNLLVSDRGIEALVLHPVNEGISILREAKGRVFIQARAAEPWDRVVAHAAGNNWWGIENLSHIPGQTGAALVQNIGAYGQQLSGAFESAEVADLSSGNVRTLEAKECGLGYRRSIFNTTHRGGFLILSLTLRLSLLAQPHLAYPDVTLWMEERGLREPSLRQIREAIIAIRDRKFPYPKTEKGGNAGSFFKNLTLRQEEYEALEQRIQDGFGAIQRGRLRELRNRFTSREGIRIPTAFLLEICGLKGYRLGAAEVNETQPLVLLNQGGATARDVLMLARHVRQTVFARTGCKIEIEPELAGFSPPELETYLALDGSRSLS